MFNVMYVIKGETREIGFDSFHKACAFYNELVAKYAPDAVRETACWDVDYKPNNVIRLMRGRLVEEYAAF